MRIFLTGATGYIGSAVLDAALRANHQITALVRTPQAADALASRGVTPVLGDLKTLKSYRAAAEGLDSYIHTAADSSPKREEVDRKAIDTLLGLGAARAKSSPVSFVYTSGIWVLGSNAQPMDETAQPNPGQLLGWRPGARAARAASGDGRICARRSSARASSTAAIAASSRIC